MLVVSLNFILTISKFRRNRIFDGIADAAFLVIMCYLFKGTFSALVVGAGASLIMSIYLEFFPLKNPFHGFIKWIKCLLREKHFELVGKNNSNRPPFE